jgi:hypothetical protein
LTLPDFYVCRNPAHIFPSTLFVFSLGGVAVVICPPVSATNKTDRHDIAEILLKVALNTIKQTNK